MRGPRFAPALRHARRPWFRARLRAAGQPSRAGLVLEEVGVRHVERHSRLRSSDELAALHAPLGDGPRHYTPHRNLPLTVGEAGRREQRLSESDVQAVMGQSTSTGRGTSAAGRGPTAPANGSAAARQQQQQRQVAAGRGYPGASTVAQFNVNSGNSQAIPNIGQMQNIFLEGTRPDLSRLNNPQRQAAPQAQLQRTFTIRNDVNLKKNSLRLVADEEHPERYHLEFDFDAAAECGITVHYDATEISGAPRPTLPTRTPSP